MATTRGTNALLERRLTPTALFITHGFGDLLEIGDQRRPDLFALDIRRPAPLYSRVIEVHERLDAHGNPQRAPDLDEVESAARGAMREGIRTAAVAFMHSWRQPRHELMVADMLRRIGFEHVSISSQLTPRLKLLSRARTAVVNAALSGPLDAFVAGTRAAWGEPVREEDARNETSAGDSAVLLMTSSGGLVAADRFAPKDSLLSGPAAGVAGAAAVAARAGFNRIIAFDMGGTSTDASRIDQRTDYTTSHRVGDAELTAPALAIQSVAAGGGSVCTVETVQTAAGYPTFVPRVGPRSAGANPGPACYGRGGPLTVTDVNLLCGRIDPANFQIPIDAEPSRQALQLLMDTLARTGVPADSQRCDGLLDAYIAVANQHMARAIRLVSVRRGYDPSEYTLVAFGGAGGQHACGVAAEIGVHTVLFPADASLLSAVGLCAARLETVIDREVQRPLSEIEPALEGLFQQMLEQADQHLRRDGTGSLAEAIRRMVSLRYAGQAQCIEIEWETGSDLVQRFEARSAQLFGHVLVGRLVEVESLRLVAAAGDRKPLPAGEETITGAFRTDNSAVRRARFGGEWVQCRVLQRAQLGEGERVEGPILIADQRTTVVIEPGWFATMNAHGDLIAQRKEEQDAATPARADESITRELLAGRLVALAEEMGELLGRTAVSTNVKERLDYSCAVLDGEGRLVMSAPHIPVHLGAMGLCVRSVVAALPLGPGDVAVTNHPAFGGSHLPDVTLVAPAHDSAGGLLGYVACRAHHAEIGGTRPGSMPPDATTLAQEGVVIPPMLLSRGGRAEWRSIQEHLTGQPHPTRALAENLADLRAQLAAINYGKSGLNELASLFGREPLADAMNTLLDRAASRVAAALEGIGSRRALSERTLDDGSPIRVSVGREAGVPTIDFTGSGAEHPGNFNAPLAVVHSAVMYTLRLLLGAGIRIDEVPLNDGLLRGVRVVVPSGMLNPVFSADPTRCPAVAAGNVETSQQVVSSLLGALGLCADSQGTMNNLLLGNGTFGYYETIGGGAGAGPGFDGASAVHTHMTNTAITEPEVLEQRYPLVLEQFAVRRGSGGAGRWRGGDGIVRTIRFLEPMSVSLLCQQRRSGPSGCRGGSAGSPGQQWLTRVGGAVEPLGGVCKAEVVPGDRLTIQTPGGGGFGVVHT